MAIRMKRTERGFNRGEFVDRYDSKCSIQESSLATEAAIWFGVDVDFKGNEARMHLTQEQVQDLLPLLQEFVQTGGLPRPKDMKTVSVSVTTEYTFEAEADYADEVVEEAKDNPDAGWRFFESDRAEVVLEEKECAQILSVDGDEPEQE